MAVNETPQSKTTLSPLLHRVNYLYVDANQNLRQGSLVISAVDKVEAEKRAIENLTKRFDAYKISVIKLF